MFSKFYPKQYANSSYDINYLQLYKQGFRGILFDIDNTLVEHDADASERAIQLFEKLKEIGFQVCLISNNGKERVERFNKNIGANYIYKAHKPGKKSYLKAMELMNTSVKDTVFVGDQLFTDVYGANRVGMYSFLVNPISPKEEIQIVFKRRLEKIVLHFYKKQAKI